MATFSSIFAPASERATKVTLVAATSSTSVVLGSSASGSIFVITGDSDMTIRFGNSTNIGDADANDFYIWAQGYVQFQVPVGCDRFRLFSTAGGAAYVWQLGRS